VEELLDDDTRLKLAIEKRDKLKAKSQKIAGKKEAAASRLEAVRKEIHDNNLDPDTLSETLQQLESALRSSLEDFESKLEDAASALEKYEA